MRRAAPDLPETRRESKRRKLGCRTSVANRRAEQPGTATKPTQYSITPSGKFDLKGAFWQSFGVTFFFEAWRVAFDPGMRWNIAHKPFFHDWFRVLSAATT